MISVEEIVKAAEYVRQSIGTAEIGIVLGSGLGNFVSELEEGKCISYKDIPGFPTSTVPGHAGCFWSGTLCGKRVYMMQGRFHTYEGYEQDQITMYVRMMKLLGVKSLILTNAAGCVNLQWKPGDLMMLTDFINFSGKNPLIGPNMDAFGTRFPDMSHVYDRELLELGRKAAQKLDLVLREGVYMWFNGPCFETPAEIRMARIVGADAVGMSTVPESIVAVHCGMRVMGISCLTNMAAGILDQPLTHAEVTETAERVRNHFTALLREIVLSI